MLERHTNDISTAEIEKLRAEILMYKEALNNAKCASCGGQTYVREVSYENQQLRLENARLKEEAHTTTFISQQIFSLFLPLC